MFFESKNIFLCLFFWCMVLCAVVGQPLQNGLEPGTPFIQNYGPNEYQAHVQNWASIQDLRGVMYFANVGGVLEYDGVSWELIRTKNSTHVRSLDVDNQGRIYVGAFGEIGYIDYDSLGRSYFSSLNQYLDTAFHDILDVWKTFCKDDGIYFSSYEYLLRWSPPQGNAAEGSFKVWKPSSRFHFAYSIGERLFIQERGKGLLELVNDSLQLIAGGDKFKDSWVFAMMEQQDGNILIVDRTHGLFNYDGKELKEINAPAHKQIIDSKVFHGIALPDGTFALATNLNGILIINREGYLLRTIDISNGLQNQSATSLYLDRQDGLWVTLSNGIDRVEINSPITLFNAALGESNSVHSIIRHRGKIHFATGAGVFVLEDQQTLRKIEGITTQCWDFASIGQTLLVATTHGLFSIDNKVTLIDDGVFRSLYQSKKNPTQIFVGKQGNLGTYSLATGKIEERLIQTEIKDWIFFIDEDPFGYLWCSTPYNGVFRLATDSSGNILSWQQLGLDHGLPTLRDNTARTVGERLLVTTQNGVYAFDTLAHHFIADSVFSDAFVNTTIHLVADRNRNAWLHGKLNDNPLIGYGTRKNTKGYVWETTPFRRFTKEFRVYTIYPDVDSITWFGGPNGVVRYDHKVKKQYHQGYRALIRKVFIGQDSLIYGGALSNDLNTLIDYEHNALRFEFAAPSYDNESDNQYSYFLEGFDNAWSDWSTETRKDYTNLPHGKYDLHVKAKNVYDEISNEDVFAFSILPPWYYTWWAYLLYGICVAVVLILTVRWRSKQIRDEKENLERLVSERTREVAIQADQLRTQAVKLKDLDRAKSRFFANISHEFRTPLTLISGCADDLSSYNDDSRLSVIRRNTNRLRQLIDQLLDLSKLEGGKFKLNVQELNARSFLSAITSSFSSWARQKNITLTIQLPEESTMLCFDPDVLEKIINNLLSNAIKFTPNNGTVLFSAHWASEEMTIQVSDNGIGIPHSKIDSIFDRFYQVDDSNIRSQEGSGIGLALVKELTLLHHGDIRIKSEPNQGTKFTVIIQMRELDYSVPERGPEKVSQNVFENITSLGTDRPQLTEPTSESPIILVVEDNIDLAQYIGEHLVGCNIVLSFNGIDGFSRAVQQVPDLIISDVMMPEMDGVELCKKLKGEEKTSHIPVILLTAKADIESRLEGLETGADDYITKPFDARELKTRVNNLIQQRKTLQKRFSRTVILKPKDIAITSPDEIFLDRVMAIIENHISNSEFSVDDFQQEIGMSRMQLHRKLKALTGHSVGEFVRIQRLIRASELLSKTDNNISEVCYQTGFTSLSYFAKCFKKQFGTTPKEYASTHSA